MIAAWLASLWAAAFRGGAALLLAWALCYVPRVPAAVRCWTWRAAYAVLLVSLVWTTPVELPLLPAVVALPKQDRSDVVQPNQGVSNRLAPTVPPSAVSTPGPTVAPTAKTATAAPWHPLWPTLAFSLWIAFLAAFASRLAMGWLNARRLRKGRLVDVPEVADLCRTMGIRRPPAVRTHPAVRVPLLAGLWRPVILLPEGMVGSTRLGLVLAHELAHLRRADLLWNWLPTLAMAALPLHPLLWIANRQWRLATEAACDAAALAATAADPAEYGRVLVNIACVQPPSAFGVLAVAAVESRWLLKRRLTAMSNITRWNRRRLVTAGLIVGVFTLAATVPWRVAARQPENVTGGPQPPTPSTLPATAPSAASPDRLNALTIGSIAIPQANIRSLTPGTVEQVNFVEGQAVKKGDLLVQLSGSRAQTDAVASASEIVKSVEERYDDLQAQYKHGVVSHSDVLQAKVEVDKAKDTLQQRETELERSRIMAPFDGVLADLKTSVGSTVLVGDAIATVFNTSESTVDFAVPSDEARWLKRGMPIEITSRDVSQVLGRGEITAAGRDVDSNTGTMRFQAKLTDTNLPLASGEFVNVKFHRGE